MQLPENIYTNAHAIDDLFWKAFWLTSVTFVVVLAILIYFMVAYRARPGKAALYTHGNSKKILGLTLSLSLAVFIGIDINLAWSDHTAFETMYGDPPAAGEAYTVQVLAKQFEWNFRYAGPDGKFGTADDFWTTNELYVPVDRKVRLELQSMDVIHSFFLPNARIKQDVVPGLQTAMWFELNHTTAQARKDRNDETFNYEIACAQLCGILHTQMEGRVIILSQEDFAAWQTKRLKEMDLYDWPSVDNTPIWSSWKARGAEISGTAAAGAK